MSAMPVASTVRDRLLAAGLSLERIEMHAAAGTLRVDGEPAGLDDAASPPARVVIVGS